VLLQAHRGSHLQQLQTAVLEGDERPHISETITTLVWTHSKGPHIVLLGPCHPWRCWKKNSTVMAMKIQLGDIYSTYYDIMRNYAAGLSFIYTYFMEMIHMNKALT
jgi:hypothetical protein